MRFPVCVYDPMWMVNLSLILPHCEKVFFGCINYYIESFSAAFCDCCCFNISTFFQIRFSFLIYSIFLHRASIYNFLSAAFFVVLLLLSIKKFLKGSAFLLLFFSCSFIYYESLRIEKRYGINSHACTILLSFFLFVILQLYLLANRKRMWIKFTIVESLSYMVYCILMN